MSELVGIVLAGGRGTRFDEGNKLLATLEESPIVSHAARSLNGEAVDHAVAILGHDADAVRDATEPHVDEIRENPAYERGQSRSVRLGARVASERDADAVLFLPGDMPCVDRATIDRLAAAFRGSDHTIVVPTYEGRRGNPVLFDATHFDALQDVTGDTGGRTLLERNAVHRAAVDDPGVRIDVDTVADRDRLRQSDCSGGRA